MKYQRVIIGVLAGAVTAVALSTELTRAGGPEPKIVETEKVGVPVKYEDAREYEAVVPHTAPKAVPDVDVLVVPGLLRDGGTARKSLVAVMRGDKAVESPVAPRRSARPTTAAGRSVPKLAWRRSNRVVNNGAARRRSAVHTIAAKRQTAPTATRPHRVLIAQRQVSDQLIATPHVVAYQKPTLKQKIGKFFKGLKSKFVGSAHAR